jgi:hypothetical protein
MKKFEFGLFALCVLIGGYIGSMFGIAIAICAFMTLDGLAEELLIRSREQKMRSIMKKENK